MGKDLSTADSESKISKLPSIPRHHVSIICEQHLRHYCPARHVMGEKGEVQRKCQEVRRRRELRGYCVVD